MKIKIISGLYRGRFIEAPSGHKTHPMSEKMRGAIFNMLGDITNLSFLDAYSGSGAIAIEAASRQAGPIVAVEKDRHAYEVIRRNCDRLAITSMKVSRANIISWLKNNPSIKFDIIVCDPPYDNIRKNSLITIASHLAPNGVLILSVPPTSADITIHGMHLLSAKTYGDAALLVYKAH